MRRKRRKVQSFVSPAGRTYKEDRANPVCRYYHINRFGDEISVMGRKGFSWTVVIKRFNGPCQAIIFREGRIPALRFYAQLVNEYKTNKKRSY